MKKLQKTLAITGLFAMIISLTLNISSVQAVPSTFVQTDWSGGQTTNTANDTSNQTGWTEYSSKDTSINTSTDLTLQGGGGFVVQTSDTDFALGTDSNTDTNGTGDAAAIELLRVSGEAVVQVSTGSYYTCATTNSGNVYCWGRNNQGQLGDNTTINKSTPIKVQDGVATGPDSDGINLINVNSVSVGRDYACATTNSGNVYCWGSNSAGQLGDGTTTNSVVPVRVLAGAATGPDSDGINLINVSSVSAGYGQTCATTNSGNVYCWGSNSYGQLGDNTTINKSTPIKVQDGVATGPDSDGINLINVNSVSAGYYHTCVTTNSGNVYCWGYNGYGQLGDNTRINKSTPIKVQDGVATGPDSDGINLINVSSVSAGYGHTCATTNSVNVYCWGRNSYGQLGDNTTISKSTPIKVQDGVATGPDSDGINLINVNLITNGLYHTCATTNSGNTYCWGHNSYGQLGNDTTISKSTPIKVQDGVATGPDSDGINLINVSSVSAGYYHTCVTTNSGNVYCWGSNSYGQLGDNTTIGKHTPIKTTGALNAIYQTSGTFTSNAIDTNQTNTFTTLDFTKNTSTNTTLTVDTRAGNTTIPDASWTSWQTDIQNTGSLSALNGNRYVQYRLNLSTTDTTVTPSLSDITFNYQTSATGDFSLISSVYNSEIGANALKQISWTENLLSNTDIKFQLRTSSDNITWSDWLGPDNTNTSYYTDPTGNETIASSHSDGVNDKYYQYKAILSSTDGNNSPILSDTSIQYEIGNVIVPDPDTTKMQSVIDDGYITLDNGTIDSTTQTTTQVQVTFQSNTTDAVFPTNTIITEATGTNFNFQNFVTQNTLAQEQATYPNAIGAVRIGVPNTNLSFSNNITLQIQVSSAYNGMELEVLSKLENSSTYNTHTTCTITNGICEFTTNHATTYIVNTNGTVSGQDPININVQVQSTLSLDCFDKSTGTGDTTVTLGTSSSPGNVTAGIPAVGESRCNITTNDDKGYYLTAINDDTQSTGSVLSHTMPDNTVVSIDDTLNSLTRWNWDGSVATGNININTTLINWDTQNPTGLGFSITTIPANETTNNNLNSSWTQTNQCPETSDTSNDYAAFPNAQEAIVGVVTYQPTTTTTDICYKVDVPASQPSGTYTGSITYTATTDATSL